MRTLALRAARKSLPILPAKVVQREALLRDPPLRAHLERTPAAAAAAPCSGELGAAAAPCEGVLGAACAPCSVELEAAAAPCSGELEAAPCQGELGAAFAPCEGELGGQMFDSNWHIYKVF